MTDEIRINVQLLPPPAQDLVSRIYHVAMDYDYAWFTLNEHCILRISLPPGATVPCGMPSVVLLSFCTELYLKCLCAITVGNPPRTHSLVGLFNCLPLVIQEEIEVSFFALVDPNIQPKTDHLDVALPLGHYNFRSVLNRVDSSFEKWRYAYETKTALEFSHVEEIKLSVVKCIRRLRPELPTFDQHHGRLPTFLNY